MSDFKSAAAKEVYKKLGANKATPSNPSRGRGYSDGPAKKVAGAITLGARDASNPSRGRGYSDGPKHKKPPVYKKFGQNNIMMAAKAKVRNKQ